MSESYHFQHFWDIVWMYPLDLLAQDINESNPPKIAQGFSWMTLAFNLKNKQEVHETIELARKAGATIAKEPQKVFWGGYMLILPTLTSILGK